jgi:antitoxin ParD1/3/4
MRIAGAETAEKATVPGGVNIAQNGVACLQWTGADAEHQPDTDQDAFIEDVIKSGEYQNASEAVRDALRVLRQRRREDALRLKALRLQIKAGRKGLDRGDFTEVDEADPDVFFEQLISPAGKSSR